MQVLLILSLFIAFLVILFALQNVDPVIIRFLIWETKGSLALVLIITLLAGSVISYLATLPGLIRRRLTISHQQNQIAELQARLGELEQQIERENEEKNKAT